MDLQKRLRDRSNRKRSVGLVAFTDWIKLAGSVSKDVRPAFEGKNKRQNGNEKTN